MRKALGATAWDLVPGSLVEGLLIAIPATAVGLLADACAIDLLASVVPESLPRIEVAAIDWRVGMFAIVTSIVATLLFSIARGAAAGVVAGERGGGVVSGAAGGDGVAGADVLEFVAYESGVSPRAAAGV